MIKQSCYHCLVLVLLVFWACGSSDEAWYNKRLDYHLTTYPVGGGWGYSIYKGKREWIRQTSLPALPGNTPFATEQQAKAVGELVLAKLNNRVTPSITAREVDSLLTLPIP